MVSRSRETAFVKQLVQRSAKGWNRENVQVSRLLPAGSQKPRLLPCPSRRFRQSQPFSGDPRTPSSVGGGV